MHDAALLEEVLMGSCKDRALALSRLLIPLGLRLPAGGGDPRVTGVAHGSQAVRPGDVFVAIRGARDGADFAADAVARGAVAVVASSPDRHLGVPWITVPDARAALADLADVAFGRPSTKILVFGVTGTNGKTTTTCALASILSAGGRGVGVIGTIGSRWPGVDLPGGRTTPEADELQEQLARMAADGCAAAALEVSSHGIDLQRVRGVTFAAVAFTNLSQDHLDWHGDLETYYATKARLFTEIAPEAPAIVASDDEHGRRLANDLRAGFPDRTIVTVGFHETSDLRIERLACDAGGVAFRLVGSAAPGRLAENVDMDLRVAMPGRHNAQNAAVAAALALVTGAPASLVPEGLMALRGVPGRLEPVPDEGNDGIDVYVDYAHTPAALEGVLTAARGFCRGRIVCVFGCGGDRDREKRALMGGVVGDLADVAIVTSDNPRNEDPLAILQSALAGATGRKAEVHAEPDRRAAIELALEMARPGDVVIIAGKGHETYQEIAGVRHPFDDRVVARELRRRRSR